MKSTYSVKPGRLLILLSITTFLGLSAGLILNEKSKQKPKLKYEKPKTEAYALDN